VEHNAIIYATYAFYAFLAAVGLCAGSFFNVMIWRIPRGKSIAWPPSHCPKCGKNIKAYDNIPVVSYLILGGKCRNCKARIPITYPIVEFLTAAILITAWTLLNMNTTLRQISAWYDAVIPILRVISIIMLIPMAVIDIRHYIIPNRFTLTLLGLAVALSLIPGNLSIAESLLGVLAGAGPLLGLGILGTYLFKKGDAMGMGDVKLMAALGALWGAQTVLIGMAFGALLGSIAGGILILSKKINDEHRIPFGPFLGAGTVVAIFVGDPLWQWYLRMFYY
jgi:leader peptidase (prepilin peptidase)/N-methyltransferase